MISQTKKIYWNNETFEVSFNWIEDKITIVHKFFPWTITKDKVDDIFHLAEKHGCSYETRAQFVEHLLATRIIESRQELDNQFHMLCYALSSNNRIEI